MEGEYIVRWETAVSHEDGDTPRGVAKYVLDSVLPDAAKGVASGGVLVVIDPDGFRHIITFEREED